ncbi:DUF6292 family protein [Rhodococcus sp. NPDC003322]
MDYEISTESGFRRYVESVSAAVGAAHGDVRWQFCASGPASEAYIPLPRDDALFPGRELALIWLDSGGWRLAVETRSGEDMITLGSTTGAPVPHPESVVALCNSCLQAHRSPP